MHHRPPTRRRNKRRTRGTGGIRSFRTESCGAGARIDLLRRLVLPDLFGPDRDDAHAARANVNRLARALRAERSRGRAGHWTYDLNRHLALSRALGEETRRMHRLESAETRRAAATAGTEPGIERTD